MLPTFLTLQEILAIHNDQIERYGGEPGVRDWRLLESATAMPQAGFSGRYFHTDLCGMAAAYLYHIVQNHPFVDGNKRTGTVAAMVFLALNDVEFHASEDALLGLVLAVANGRAGKPEIAKFFREHST